LGLIYTLFFATIMMMDPEKNQELAELLQKNITLSEENNRLLRSLNRTNRWSLIFSSIKWIVVIGSFLGLYYYFGQFLEIGWNQYQSLLGGYSDQAKTVNSANDTINDLIKTLKESSI